MDKTKGFSAVITREGRWFVSVCPELHVASQGTSVQEALSMLKEAVELYLEADIVPVVRKPSTTVSFSPILVKGSARFAGHAQMHAKTSRPLQH